MSNLVVSNISDGTTSVGTGYVVNGSAKAWVNFNGAGTVAVRDSINLSSLTDNGTGDYTINFTNTLANANYNSTMSCGEDYTGNSGLRVANALSDTARTASAIRMSTSVCSSTVNRTSLDDNTVSATIHGDLA